MLEKALEGFINKFLRDSCFFFCLEELLEMPQNIISEGICTQQLLPGEVSKPNATEIIKISKRNS